MIKQTYPRREQGQKKISAEQYRQMVQNECTKNGHRATNVLRGGQNKAAGETFEQLLSAGCEHYKLTGVAEIEKTPEPMRPIERITGNTFKAVFEKKAQPDYKGTLYGGRSIVFEAKSSANARIQQSALTKAQQERLEHHAELGAACFVMVSLCGMDYYTVPWNVWQKMKPLYGRKYMRREEMKKYKVPLEPCRKEQGGWMPGIKFLKGVDMNELQCEQKPQADT